MSKEDVVDKHAESCTVEDAPTLQRRAIWCGVVCSLALLLTVLNFFPPSRVRYHVRSEVIVAKSRIDRIAASLKADGQTECEAILTRLNVLDDETQDVFADLLADSAVAGPKSALIELQSLWKSRCDEESHQRWLSELTRVDESELASTDVARQKRMTAWEVSAAEHYMRRHEYLTNKSPLSTSEDGRVFELATRGATTADSTRSRRGVPAQLASYSQPANEADTRTSVSSQATQAQIRALLGRQLLDSSQRAKSAEQQWRQAAVDASGTVRLATKPEVQALCESIPTVFVMSILILGFVGGLGGTMAFRHLQCSGVHSPDRIAAELSLQGVPIAGSVSLTHHERDDDAIQERVGRACGNAGKWIGRNLTMVAEIVVGCWALLVIARLVFDPIWSAVLFDSPLIALSHLWIGMP